GTLRLEKSTIGYPVGFPFASGVAFAPSGAAKLHVSDCFIAHTGIGNANPAAGIYILPSAGVQATVTIERSVIDDNLFGILVDAATNGGAIRGAVKDSTVSGNTNNGITAS